MGDLTLPEIASTIVGILLFSVVILSAAKIYAATQETERSFYSMISSIKELEDNEVSKESLQLPEESILVSFIDKKDCVDCGALNQNIKVPVSCGEYPCICICSLAWLTTDSEACTKKEEMCYPFADTITNIVDLDNSGGLYRKGTPGNSQQIYFKKQGSTVIFCSSEDCIPEQYNETINGFKNFIEFYKSCQSSGDNCTCSSNFSFLPVGYAITFYNDKIELNYLNTGVIYTETFATNIQVEDQTFTTFSYYPMDVVVATTSRGNTYLTYYVISESFPTYTSTLSLKDNQIEVKSKLLKSGSNIYFTEKDLSSYSSCTDDPRQFL